MQAAYLIGNMPFPDSSNSVTSDATKLTLGTKQLSEDSYWGAGDFVWGKLASGSMNTGRLVTLDASFAIADLANTANTGGPFGVVRTAIDATAAVAYGWVQVNGRTPVQTSAAGSTGPMYIGAAGQATTTAAAGKQLLGATSVIAGSGTLAKTGTTTIGLKTVTVTSPQGLFVGQAVTGTGIAASTTISALDVPNMTVTLNNAATASGTVTLTFTNTGFVVAQIVDGTVQGQIT